MPATCCAGLATSPGSDGTVALPGLRDREPAHNGFHTTGIARSFTTDTPRGAQRCNETVWRTGIDILVYSYTITLSRWRKRVRSDRLLVGSQSGAGSRGSRGRAWIVRGSPGTSRYDPHPCQSVHRQDSAAGASLQRRAQSQPLPPWPHAELVAIRLRRVRPRVRRTPPRRHRRRLCRPRPARPRWGLPWYLPRPPRRRQQPRQPRVQRPRHRPRRAPGRRSVAVRS